MARPRAVSDRQILDATLDCLTEHGPGVSLAVIARTLGVSPATLVKRFGSKDALVFQALLPRERPDWHRRLDQADEAQALPVLIDVLVEVCDTFDRVGAALAALRMSAQAVERIFPPDQPGPPVRLRAAVAAHLRRHDLVETGAEEVAELLLGAVEARGFLGWVAPHFVVPVDDLRGWVGALVDRALAR